MSPPLGEYLTAFSKRWSTTVVKASSLADTRCRPGSTSQDATRPGGLGNPFNWKLLQSLEPGVPFLLSGGLDAGNVAEAVGVTRASGVDVSSGVERAPGQKDPDKIRAFIRAVRQAHADMAAASGSPA